jgi:vacuolar-type H+-ATPase subunit E/Vma4
MSLRSILGKIRASGEAQILEIEKNAQSRKSAILAQAQMEAHQVEEDAKEAASTPAVAERARILHRSRLDALRIVGNVRKELVDLAIARTGERLSSMRADPSYPEVFRMLMHETLTELASSGTDKVQLAADPRDRELLEKILSDLGLNPSVSYELNCWGGLIAMSLDGRVVVINTFESRLERATAILRYRLVTLFEEKHTQIGQVEVIAQT